MASTFVKLLAKQTLAWRWKFEQNAINEHVRVGTAKALVLLSAAHDESVVVSKTALHLTPWIASEYGDAARPEAHGNGLSDHLVL